MKKRFINSIMNYITKNKEIDNKKILAMKYGLEGVYNTLIKTIIVIIVTLFINTFQQFLLLLIFYSLLRAFSYGLHASSSLVCWLTTLPVYIIGSILIKYLAFNNTVYLIVWLIGFISTILWAPADTPKRPLIHKSKRITRKIITIIITNIYLALILIINKTQVSNAIALAQIIEIISINPLSYFLTKTTFNNYKHYVKKV